MSMQTGQCQNICATCIQAIEDDDLPVLEKHRLAIDIDIGLINQSKPKIADRTPKRKEKLEDFVKSVTALKNSGGGALFVHIQGLHQDDRCFSYFNEFVDEKLTSLLENGELFVDSYSKCWLSEETYKDFLCVTVRASRVLSTADFKTKVTSDESITRPTSKTIALLLFGKERETCEPEIRGLAGIQQENHKIQLKYFDNSLFEGDLLDALPYIWNDLRLKQYFTTFSKNTEGGSYFLGVREIKTDLRAKAHSYTTKTSDPTGIKINKTLHEKFMVNLKKLVQVNIFNPFEQDFDVTHLYTAVFHPVDESKDLFVLEVAVGSVSRCVFYEIGGPEAYRILDDGNIVLLPFEKWSSKIKKTYRIPDSYEKPVQWPSNSNFPFTVRQVKNAFDDIYKYMLPKDQLSIILPPRYSIKDQELLKNLNKRFLELGNATKHGLVHATKSLTVLLNLDPIEVPDGIKLEVFIILPDRSCRILCVTDDIHNHSHKKYLLRLTRNVTSRLRKFTSEHVTVLYGLVDKNEMSSNDTFSQKMKDIQKEISQFCIPDSLVMNKAKCDNIIRAFLASIAATDLVSVKNDDKQSHEVFDIGWDEETLWLFTPQQFKVFVENIDRGMVVLKSVPKSGATLLVEEVKRRLNKIVPNTKHERGISSWISISVHSLETWECKCRHLKKDDWMACPKCGTRRSDLRPPAPPARQNMSSVNTGSWEQVSLGSEKSDANTEFNEVTKIQRLRRTLMEKKEKDRNEAILQMINKIEETTRKRKEEVDARRKQLENDKMARCDDLRQMQLEKERRERELNERMEELEDQKRADIAEIKEELTEKNDNLIKQIEMLATGEARKETSDEGSSFW